MLIDVRTLTDGGQRAPDVAQMVAAFIEPARETLELALYDVRLHDDTAEVVRGAIKKNGSASTTIKMSKPTDTNGNRRVSRYLLRQSRIGSLRKRVESGGTSSRVCVAVTLRRAF